MTRSADTPEIKAKELRELSALADGSLEASRRPAVKKRISASPELSALYERERRVVDLLHESSSTVRAPASLRARIDAERPRRPVRARRRFGFGGALAGALAAVIAAVILIAPGSTPVALAVSDAAALGTLAPTHAAPAPDADSPGKLSTNVQDVYFPNWGDRFGWRASGERRDKLHGRSATTVYYDWKGRRLAYTIVASPPLKTPSAATSTRDGVEFRTFEQDGRTVITWRRNGHTCVLSGTNVNPTELQKLAVWDGTKA